MFIGIFKEVGRFCLEKFYNIFFSKERKMFKVKKKKCVDIRPRLYFIRLLYEVARPSYNFIRTRFFLRSAVSNRIL